MTIRTTLLATLLAAAAASAFAQAPAATSTPAVDARQQRQAARIEHGAASGALTHREQRHLNRDQHAIQHAENKAKADGVVTSAERAKLHHLQNHAHRDIRHHKHDRQRAASAPQ